MLQYVYLCLTFRLYFTPGPEPPASLCKIHFAPVRVLYVGLTFLIAIDENLVSDFFIFVSHNNNLFLILNVIFRCVLLMVFTAVDQADVVIVQESFYKIYLGTFLQIKNNDNITEIISFTCSYSIPKLSESCWSSSSRGSLSCPGKIFLTIQKGEKSFPPSAGRDLSTAPLLGGLSNTKSGESRMGTETMDTPTLAVRV